MEAEAVEVVRLSIFQLSVISGEILSASLVVVELRRVVRSILGVVAFAARRARLRVREDLITRGQKG